MPAYADGNDLVARYDIDLVRDLATDREGVDRAAIVTEPRVLVALEDASGEVEVALQTGGRYTSDQLATLTGNSLGHLKKIVCGLAIAALFERRPESADAEYINRATKTAREAIAALSRGENVFGFPETLDASVVEIASPTVLDIRRRNDLPQRMSRFFPADESRLPRN